MNIILEIEQVQYVKLGSQTNLNLQFFELLVLSTVKPSVALCILQTEAVMLHCFCLFDYDFGMPSTLNE